MSMTGAIFYADKALRDKIFFFFLRVRVVFLVDVVLFSGY